MTWHSQRFPGGGSCTRITEGRCRCGRAHQTSVELVFGVPGMLEAPARESLDLFPSPKPVEVAGPARCRTAVQSKTGR